MSWRSYKNKSIFRSVVKKTQGILALVLCIAILDVCPILIFVAGVIPHYSLPDSPKNPLYSDKVILGKDFELEANDKLINVTLITGDTVIVSTLPDGKRSFTIKPADPTRIGQHFQILNTPRGTYIIPEGVDLSKLDMELFNIDYLINEGYYEMPYLPVIISVDVHDGVGPVDIKKSAQALQEIETEIKSFNGRTTTRSVRLSMLASQLPIDTVKDSISTLLARPYVKKIWLDKKVHVSLSESIPLVGAPAIWSDGYNGSGIEIAILDTGIDATHPDLDDLDDNPNTMDPKVIRAIDFTDDNDVNDLHGHGTHHAGIAAGTGQALSLVGTTTAMTATSYNISSGENYVPSAHCSLLNSLLSENAVDYSWSTKPVIVNVQVNLEREEDQQYILNILSEIESHGWITSVFVTGEFAYKHPEAVREIESRGHYIGVYGWKSGEDISLLNYSEQLELIKKAVSTVRSAVSNPKYVVDFKPQNLKYNDDTIKVLQALGMKSITAIFDANESFVQCLYAKSVGKVTFPYPITTDFVAVPISDITLDSEEVLLDDSIIFSKLAPEGYLSYLKKEFDEHNKTKDPMVIVVNPSITGADKTRLHALSQFLDYVEENGGKVKPTASITVLTTFIPSLRIISAPQSVSPEETVTVTVEFTAAIYCPSYYFRIYGKYPSESGWRLHAEHHHGVQTGTFTFSKSFTIPEPPVDDSYYIVRVVSQGCAGTCWPTPYTYEKKDEVNITIKRPEMWTFAIITDLHIGRGYEDYKGEDYYLTERLRRTVDWVIENKDKMKIKFVVVLGDISESGKRSELEKAKSILDKLNEFNIPYIPVIGNHDLNLKDGVNYFMVVFKSQFDWINKSADSKIYLQPQKSSMDALDYKVNFRFSYRNIHFIGLDFVNREKPKFYQTSPKGILHEETKTWLNKSLQEWKDEQVIVFSHHPILMDSNPLLLAGLSLDIPMGCDFDPFNGFSLNDLLNIAEIVRESGRKNLYIFAGHKHYFREPHRILIWLEPPFYGDPTDANKEYLCNLGSIVLRSITTEALMHERPPHEGMIRIVAPVKFDRALFLYYNLKYPDEDFVAFNPFIRASVKKIQTNDLEWEFEPYPFPVEGISSYNWDFDGDGKVDVTTITKEKVTWQYEQYGRYTVKLTVSNNRGFEEWITKDIAVNRTNWFRVLPEATWKILALFGEVVEDITNKAVGIFDRAKWWLIGAKERSPAKPIFIIQTNFEGITNNITIDLTDLRGDTDLTARKSFFYTSSWPPEINQSKTLFIPSTGVGTVYICPNATSLDEVTPDCPNKAVINVGETVNGMAVAITYYNGEEYYMVSNVTGTGTGGGEATWIERPDLSLTSSDISLSNSNPILRDTVIISAAIHNIGEADANSTFVMFYDGNPETGAIVGWDIVDVPAGGTAEASIVWNASLAGTHEIYVVAKIPGFPTDKDPTNNMASRVIDVRDTVIRGRVVDYGGNPVSYTYIYAIGPITTSTITDADGNYRITGLESGHYTLRAEPINPNLMIASAYVYLNAGETIVQNFTLQAAGSIAGNITDVNGKGIPNLIVYLSGYETPRYRTDEDGHYVIPRLTAGTYTVNVDALGTKYASAHKTVEVALGNTTIANFVLHEIQYKGVAPGAYLWNVKVLNRYGWGYMSWVIAGIEYAAYGPDSIPRTGDEADIISMSFGLPGTDGTDPLSQAVNDAVNQGIVVVVAAGNSGSSWYTISNPGVAEKVITVGASTKDDKIAWFSSRGPTIDFRVKPDVVAPGVDIIAPRARNTWMGSPINDYYTRASGTSMSTPHVAGAAALILQMHPDWSPRDVKNALISTAEDLRESIYAQGGGRIYIPSAAYTEILVDPATISFKNIRNATNRVIAFHNLNTTATRNLTLNVIVYDSYTLNQVECASLNVTSLSIAPGSSASVLLTVDPATLPEGIYEGKIIASIDTGETVHIIFGFVKISKVTVLKVKMDGTPASYEYVEIFPADTANITYGSNYQGGWTDENGKITFVVPEGTYYIVSSGVYKGSRVYTVADRIEIGGDREVKLDEKETVPVTVETEYVVASIQSLLSYSYREDGREFLWSWSNLEYYPFNGATYVSRTTLNLTNIYEYYPKEDFMPSNPEVIDTSKWHKLVYSERGVRGPITHKPDYSVLVKKTTEYRVGGTPKVSAYWAQFAKPKEWEWSPSSFTWIMSLPQIRDEYLSPDVYYWQWIEKGRDAPNVETPYWRLNSKEWSIYGRGERLKEVWNAHPFSTEFHVKYERNYLSVFGNFFQDAYAHGFTSSSGNNHMTIIRDAPDKTILYDGPAGDHFYYSFWNELIPAEYTVILNGNSNQYLSTNSRTELNFNVVDENTDSTPPTVYVRIPGLNLYNIHNPGDVEVEVIVDDESSISNLGLEYSTDEGETWRPLTLTDKGKIGEYRKSVTGGSRVVLDRTYTVPVYSKLRITVDDTEDNDLIYYTYNFTLTTDDGVNYVVSGESSRTYGDINDTLAYDLDRDGKHDLFVMAYIYVYTSDEDTLDVTVEAWDGSEWKFLYGTKINRYQYQASIGSLSDVYVSLRVNATDSRGNSISQTTIRGFYILPTPTTVDLSVSEVRISPRWPIADQPVTLNATIRGLGGSFAVSFKVRLLVTKEYQEIVNETKTISMYLNETEYVEFTFSLPAGNYEVKIIVDPDNEIPESDESNNEYTLTIVVNPTSIFGLADFPKPFIMDGALGDVILTPGASDRRGPVDPAHTIDVAASNFISFLLGRYSTTGGLESYIDWEVASFDSSHVYGFWKTGNIITFGSPGVNLISYYLHHHPANNWGPVIPAYFGVDEQGQYVYSTITGQKYRMVNDYGQGKPVTDYALITLYYDDDRYIMMLAGLSGVTTREICKWLLSNPPLEGRAMIIKFVDYEGDFQPDLAEVIEVIG